MKTDYPQLRAFLRSLDAPAQEAFATACETTLNYLRKAMSKKSKMDARLVELIVTNSNHAVPASELRPDVNWAVFCCKPRSRRAAKKVVPKRAAAGGSSRRPRSRAAAPM